MKLLVINYHYLGPEDQYPYPGIYSTPVERFRGQLRELGKSFTFVSQGDLLDAVEGRRPLPERSCLVTFDDGLKSQHTIARPALDDLGIRGLFFMNGLPYREGRTAMIHQIHYCRANLAPKMFMDRFHSVYAAVTGEQFSPEAFPVPDIASRQYHRYDTPELARFKHIVSKLLPEDLKERIITPIFRELVPDEAAFVREFYLLPDEVRELAGSHDVGTHTLSHRSVSALSWEELEREISLGLESLAAIGVGNIRAIAYPFGSSAEFMPHVLSVVKRHSLALGFTMERAFNVSLRQPLLFGRADTNDVPGGKNPNFTVEAGEIKITSSSFGTHRKLYFDETKDGDGGLWVASSIDAT